MYAAGASRSSASARSCLIWQVRIPGPRVTWVQMPGRQGQSTLARGSPLDHQCYTASSSRAAACWQLRHYSGAQLSGILHRRSLQFHVVRTLKTLIVRRTHAEVAGAIHSKMPWCFPAADLPTKAVAVLYVYLLFASDKITIRKIAKRRAADPDL